MTLEKWVVVEKEGEVVSEMVDQFEGCDGEIT